MFLYKEAHNFNHLLQPMEAPLLRCRQQAKAVRLPLMRNQTGDERHRGHLIRIWVTLKHSNTFKVNSCVVFNMLTYLQKHSANEKLVFTAYIKQPPLHSNTTKAPLAETATLQFQRQLNALVQHITELRQMSNLQNQAVNAAGPEYINAPDSDYLNTHVYQEVNQCDKLQAKVQQNDVGNKTYTEYSYRLCEKVTYLEGR